MPDLTVGQAAARLGLTPGRVRQLLQSGKLPGARFGHAWMVKESALAAYTPPPRGWPKGKSRKEEPGV